MRLLQRADLAFAAIRFGAEQLDLHALRRDRGRIDGDERTALARRQRVDGACGKFLARAGRADDHDAAVGRRNTLDGLPQLAHRRRHADQVERLAAAQLEVGNLALQLRGLQRPFGDQDQAVGLERLLDEIVGAAADRGNRRLDIAVAGNHDNRQAGMHRLDLVEHRQAVEPRALQPDIQEDQPWHAVGDCRHGAVAVMRGPRFVAFVAENTGYQFTNVFFVVDDQNVRRHHLPSRFAFHLPSKTPPGWTSPGRRSRAG